MAFVMVKDKEGKVFKIPQNTLNGSFRDYGFIIIQKEPPKAEIKKKYEKG